MGGFFLGGGGRGRFEGGPLTAPLSPPPLADDAAAQVLRSVGQNAAMRGSSPFTLITLLLPLLVPGGL